MINPINLIILGGFLAFLLIDIVFRARQFSPQTLWKIRGVAATAAYFALASYSPFLWASWLDGPLMFNASALPIWAQVILGYGAVQFVAYWWHRILHESDTLWRVFHQMHHSVERMDVWGTLYHHPLDVIGFTFMGSFALTMIVGITPIAAATVGVLGAFAVFFTHCRIRTPRWIGWIFQRPEAHGLHHQRGRHAGNYAELTIWDRIFGTFENPKEWNGESGFYDGASLRIWEMLIFRDVSQPKLITESATSEPIEAKPSRLRKQAFNAVVILFGLSVSILPVIGVGASITPVI